MTLERPAFPVSDAAIRRLARQALLETQTARQIYRKSGFRPGSGAETGGTVSLGPESTLRFTDEAFLSSYDLFPGVETPVPFFGQVVSLPLYETIPISFTTGKATIETDGVYRVMANFNSATDYYQWPFTYRARAVLREGDGTFVRAALLDEVMFTAEPQGSYTPDPPLVGGGTLNNWQFMTEFTPHGEAIMGAEAGQTIGVEATWSFEGTAGPGGSGEIGVVFISFSNSREWIQRISGDGGPPSGSSPPGDAIQFNIPPPGRLTEEGGQLYADWTLADTNFGYTQTEAEDYLHSVFDDAAGWSQAGITFRQTTDAAVTIQVVETVDCEGTPAVGCTNFTLTPTLISLKHGRILEGFGPNIANHEAAHFFFGATHSGSGVMSGNSPDGYPTASDIQSVIDWLAS